MSEEWTIIDQLILGPFEELTKKLSAADDSISMILPLITTIEKYLSDLDAAGKYIGGTLTETIAFFGNFEI